MTDDFVCGIILEKFDFKMSVNLRDTYTAESNMAEIDDRHSLIFYQIKHLSRVCQSHFKKNMNEGMSFLLMVSLKY